jgi:hypothetical protein
VNIESAWSRGNPQIENFGQKDSKKKGAKNKDG